ncbi:XRE family transcriptional regulator [Burkholderia vietnamiensis]|uniref:XRE family transcriptional regulator n=1 Tax=Burkholderia vietnamiensis TaxID=60552 RepID=UPI002650721C|nr:XRE family transcriptional regulator [Burkholderia vietnamiensis]MDN7413469.1 XRE family transcriptional regulator [Burkholderia vietnamiensis]HDR8938718.1 XRE family transcriptional regulator [Burkholderia vietnamiensis]HDR9261350.1 XRE family transcriptional regulator [Burkholderia vietnamiensis]
MPIKYTPPGTRDLATLKHELNMTGKQMADLFWLAGDHQWRKYTGGQSPRELSPHMAFVAAAKLCLSEKEFARVLAKMKEFGAHMEIVHDAEQS